MAKDKNHKMVSMLGSGYVQKDGHNTAMGKGYRYASDEAGLDGPCG